MFRKMSHVMVVVVKDMLVVLGVQQSVGYAIVCSIVNSK